MPVSEVNASRRLLHLPNRRRSQTIDHSINREPSRRSPRRTENLSIKKAPTWAPFSGSLFANFFLNLRGNHDVHRMFFEVFQQAVVILGTRKVITVSVASSVRLANWSNNACSLLPQARDELKSCHSELPHWFDQTSGCSKYPLVSFLPKTW